MHLGTNGLGLLEQERKNLHRLIDQNREKSLTNDPLLEQSEKLDRLIVAAQREQRRAPEEGSAGEGTPAALGAGA